MGKHDSNVFILQVIIPSTQHLLDVNLIFSHGSHVVFGQNVKIYNEK